MKGRDDELIDDLVANPLRWNSTIIPEWLEVRKDLKATDKLLYARLHRYMVEEGSFPRQQEIAEAIGIGMHSLATSLQKLKEVRLIATNGADSGAAPATYWFLDHPMMGGDYG